MFRITKVPVNREYIFSRFWVLYFLLAILGFINNRILNLNTGTLPGAVFDAASYLVLLISCLAIEKRFVFFRESAYLYLKASYLYFMITILFLYVLSLFTSSIAGFPLRYFQYFAPLVDNLHQTAMILTPMPFVGIYLIGKERGRAMRTLIIILIFMSLIMIDDTGSFKAKLGVVVGFIGYLLTIAVGNRSQRSKTIITMFIGVFVVGFVINIDMKEIFQTFFDKNDLYGGRAYLYSYAVVLIKESWLLGRGFGGHIFLFDKYYDAHQTLLTVFMQTGFIGAVFFLRLFYKILKKSFRHSAPITGAVLSVVVYTSGGDVMRRLPIWFVLILLYYAVCQIQPDSKEKQSIYEA
jgi:hypothetical protein